MTVSIVSADVTLKQICRNTLFAKRLNKNTIKEAKYD